MSPMSALSLLTAHGTRPRPRVPIHSDPPTARALYATINIGREVQPDHYRTVATAIRFAETMRARARNMRSER